MNLEPNPSNPFYKECPNCRTVYRKADARCPNCDARNIRHERDLYDDEPCWCEGCGRILKCGETCTNTNCPDSPFLGTDWY